MPDYQQLWKMVSDPFSDRLSPDALPAALNFIEHRFRQGEATISPIKKVKDFYGRIWSGNSLPDAGEKALIEAKAQTEWIAAAWRMGLRHELSQDEREILFDLLLDPNDGTVVDQNVLDLLKNHTPDFNAVFPDVDSLTVEQLRTAFDELRGLYCWLTNDASVVGRYRMFFPVVEDLKDSKEGWLVVAQVYAIRRNAESLQGLPEHLRAVLGGDTNRLIVAPWTFYVPCDDEEQSLTQLRQNLHPAIQSVEKLLPLRPYNSGDDLIYLLELQPLAPDDVPLGLPEFQEPSAGVLRPLLTAAKLSAWNFQIEGKSIGLGIFLAAVAAITRYSFKTCLATGAIKKNDDGTYEIGSIGSVKGKLTVIEQFLKCVDDRSRFTVLFPEANQTDDLNLDESAPLRKTGILHLFPTEMDEALSVDNLARLFTDGFDEWRDALGIGVEHSPQDAVAELEYRSPFSGRGPVEEVEKRLVLGRESERNDPWGRFSDGAFLPFDINEYEALLDVLKTAFTTDSNNVASGVNEPRGLSVGVPFDEDPGAVSDWLCFHLCDDVWKKKTREELSSVPVVVPIALGDVVSAEGDIPETAELIRYALKSAAGIEISLDAIRIGLARPGKLILVVYDEKSRSLDLSDERRQQLWSMFKELADSGSVWLAMICSDEHYQRMVDLDRVTADAES